MWQKLKLLFSSVMCVSMSISYAVRSNATHWTPQVNLSDNQLHSQLLCQGGRNKVNLIESRWGGGIRSHPSYLFTCYISAGSALYHQPLRQTAAWANVSVILKNHALFENLNHKEMHCLSKKLNLFLYTVSLLFFCNLFSAWFHSNCSVFLSNLFN